MADAANTEELIMAKPSGRALAKAPVGRPSKYKPEYAEQAFKYCLLGATDDRLAELFGVNPDTVHEWKKVHKDFSDSLYAGREKADAEVAKSLYHRALGYSHAEDDIRTVSSGGGVSDIVITPTIKHYPPDTGAATLWLKNRQPKLWRDKVDVDQTVQGSVDVKVDVVGLNFEDVRKKVDALP